MKKLTLFLFASVVASGFSQADERLKGIACRSVHLAYPGPEGVAFYNEITPLKSAEGTYFSVCGWNKGYFGIQEKTGDKKVVIFSVWDPGSQQDPKTVKESDKVQMLHKDPDVRTGRFGNEGTGGQSFLDFDWKLGETYKFLVRSKPAEGEGRVEYAGYMYAPEWKAWKHLITFSTQSKKQLGGYYSFVEDFHRNKISTTKTRAALFGNTWIQGTDGKWHDLTKAQFTADSNPVLNINAKLDGSRFWLGTGGDLENTDTKLRGFMTRPEGKMPELP